MKLQKHRLTSAIAFLSTSLVVVGAIAAVNEKQNGTVERLLSRLVAKTEADSGPSLGRAGERAIRQVPGGSEFVQNDAGPSGRGVLESAIPPADRLRMHANASGLELTEFEFLNPMPFCDSLPCSGYLIRSGAAVPLQADAASAASATSASAPLNVQFDESGPYDDVNQNRVRDAFEDLGPSNVGIDSDHDGKWDALYGIYDADGDGSAIETCTGKDVPAPQCKVAGELIYRDFVDDMNALLYRNGGVLDDRIEIHLDDLVYTGCGCWDASNPLQNDCATVQNHDSLGDPSLSACQLDEFARPLWTLAVRGNKVQLSGKGADRRLNDTGLIGPGTERPTGRTFGTTIALDHGSYYSRWYTQGVQSPYMSVGMNHELDPSGSPGKSGSNPALVGNGKGWGALTQDEALHTQTHRGSVCLSNSGPAVSATGWVASLAAGDQLVCVIPVYDSASLPVGMPVRVDSIANADGGNCADSASREVFLGPGDDRVGLAWGEPDDDDGTGPAYCYKPTDGYFDGELTLENLKIEPQDYNGETGGDCSTNGLWRFGVVDPDQDCDSQPMVVHYSGNLFIEDVVIGEGMSYTVDGGPVVGFVSFDRTSWLYGRGAPIFDAGHHWRLRDIEIGYSRFNLNGGMLSFFGSYLEIDGLEIHNSSAGNVMTLVENVGMRIRNMRVTSSFVGNVVTVGCDVMDSVLESIHASGIDYGHQVTNRPIDAMLNFSCTDVMHPSIGNRFIDWKDDTGAHAEFDLDRSRLVTFNDDTDRAVFGNYFEGFHNPSIDPDSTVFGASQNQATRDVFSRNVFVGNTSRGGRVFAVTNGSGAPTTEPIGVGATGIGNLSARTPDPSGTGGIWRTAAIAIEGPVDGTERMLFKAPSDVMLASLDCVATGNVAPNGMRVQLDECDGDGGTCTGSGLAVSIDGLARNFSSASPSDPSVDSGDWIKLQVTDVAIAPDLLHCSLRYLE